MSEGERTSYRAMTRRRERKAEIMRISKIKGFDTWRNLGHSRA